MLTLPVSFQSLLSVQTAHCFRVGERRCHFVDWEKELHRMNGPQQGQKQAGELIKCIEEVVNLMFIQWSVSLLALG